MRRTALLGALTLVVMTTAGCGDIDFGQGTGQCHPKANNPHRSKGTPTDMDGKVTNNCDPQINPEQITTIARLEQKINGQWKPVTEDSTRVCTKPKDIKNGCMSMAAMPCQPGTFRTAGRGSGVLNGKEAHSTEWTYSDLVTDPCAEG